MCLSLPSTASVTVLRVVGSIFLGAINTLFGPSSSQMPGMMGQDVGIDRMMALMAKHMGMKNITTIQG
jgi:hypothetical protein